MGEDRKRIALWRSLIKFRCRRGKAQTRKSLRRKESFKLLFESNFVFCYFVGLCVLHSPIFILSIFYKGMSKMILDKIAEINGSINSVVWGTFGLALLIGTGIIVTLCTKVFQISHIGLWFKNTLGSMFKKDKRR